MTRYYLAPNSPGDTAFWDDGLNWQSMSVGATSAVPSSGDSALIDSALDTSYTAIVRYTEYSSDRPLGTLGLGSTGGTTSIVQIGGGGALYIQDIEDNYKIGLLDFSGGGTVELDGSGTLSADTFGHDISVAMTGSDNKLILPLFVPGDGFSTTLITGFGSNDTIDLTSVAFSGGVSNVVDILDSNLSFTVGVFRYTLDFLGSSRAITAADFHSDGSGGTEITLCLAAGTRIATEQDETPVEVLRAGDIVRTASGRLAPVRWVGRRRVDLARHPDPEMARPIRIAPGAISAGVPRRALTVSPDHAILIDGALIPARQLLNHLSIVRDDVSASVDYVHVELDRHDILLADGAAVESFLDQGHRGWFGEPSRPDDGIGLPIVTDEGRVWPVWRRLAVRSGVDVEAARPAAVASDLHLAVDGRHIVPTEFGDGRLAFALPPGCRTARLVCAARRPTTARPWLDDRRRLGLAVSGISVDGAAIDLSGPAFGRGWWAVEGDAPAFRWTDGGAIVHLPAAARVLTIRVLGHALRAREALRSAA